MAAERTAARKSCSPSCSSLQSWSPLKSGASSDFALGWKVETIPLAGTQVRVVRHRASAIGGATSIYLIPGRGLTIAVMDNVQNTVGVEALALQVGEAFTRWTQMP